MSWHVVGGGIWRLKTKSNLKYPLNCLGMAASIECSCGRSMPLGDFMDFEPEGYDEDKYGVLTKEKRRILNLRKQRKGFFF